MFDQILTDPLFQKNILGNSIQSYTEALIIVLALLVAFKIFQRFLLWRLDKLAQKTQTDLDDTAIKIVRSVRPPFYFLVSFYLAFTTLNSHPIVNKGFEIAVIIFLVYQIVTAVQILIDYTFKRFIAQEKDESAKSAVKTLSRVIKGVLWTIGFLLILQNVGVNVSSLVAGLGIGGVAVALAAQNLLGDLFSSFSIFFDKPFTEGDFIIIGDDMGTVKKIGIKTTRIEALQGEELVVGNQELTSTRVQNFKRMKKRRIDFQVGVDYQTPQKSLKKIPGFIKDIIKKTEGTTFDRAHLKTFGDSALIFEVVYYVKTADYNKYMDIQQKINLGIIKKFEQEKISIAYPTQTIYLKNTKQNNNIKG